MAPEPVKTGHYSTAEGESQKQLDREVREMVSALTNRLADLQRLNKSGSSQHPDDEDDRGYSVITLAGSNTGATMRSGLDDISETHSMHPLMSEQDMSAYVNSNFQAINNSIMLGGSYSSNDPGVHMDIRDLPPPQHKEHKEHKSKDGKKKQDGKKKDSGSPKSDDEHSG